MPVCALVKAQQATNESVMHWIGWLRMTAETPQAQGGKYELDDQHFSVPKAIKGNHEGKKVMQ